LKKEAAVEKKKKEKDSPSFSIQVVQSVQVLKGPRSLFVFVHHQEEILEIENSFSFPFIEFIFVILFRTPSPSTSHSTSSTTTSTIRKVCDDSRHRKTFKDLHGAHLCRPLLSAGTELKKKHLFFFGKNT